MMKKLLNIIAFIIITFIILIMFLGLGLSEGNIESDVWWVFGPLIVIFLVATHDSFFKKSKLVAEPIKNTVDYKIMKLFYYGILAFGALLTLGVVIIYLIKT